eukprot:14762_1
MKRTISINNVHKQEVYELNHQIYKNGDSHEQDQTKLISALGGIDHVLVHFLSENNNCLCQKQLNQINQILSTSTVIKMNKYKKIKKYDENTEDFNHLDELNPEIICHLETQNTFLH